jgi:hypothetical protein
MRTRPYCLTSGAVFSLVSLLHLGRLAYGWGFTIGPWSLPVGASWVGAPAAAALALWAFRLARD